MAEELELDLSENEEQTINRSAERIKDLSSKVKNTAQERDTERAKAEAEAARAATAEQERDFFKEFSTLTTKYPGSSEYQDKILEKVKAGYSPEDAAVSVLNAEGKFNPTQENVQPIAGPAAGGSASTVIPQSERSPDNMTQAERREALQAASDSGELGQTIRNWGRGN